jgi:hypothetical protein
MKSVAAAAATYPCIYPRCRATGSNSIYICPSHKCASCCSTIGLPNRYYVVVWGRMHYVQTARLDEEAARRLQHLPRTANPNIDTTRMCPNNAGCLVACQASFIGRIQSPGCYKFFPNQYFGTTNVCIRCSVFNQCQGRRRNEHNAKDPTRQCWRLFDLFDTARTQRKLCDDEHCNVRVPCARKECAGAIYKTTLHLSPPLPDLCEECFPQYHLCEACGRVAQRGKSILFSRHVYPLYMDEECCRCIHCFDTGDEEDATKRRTALLLRWWVFRPVVDKWIEQVRLETGFQYLNVQHLLLRWVSYTPLERALLMRSEDALVFARRFHAGVLEDTGEVLYRTALLPRDVFMIVFRMTMEY